MMVLIIFILACVAWYLLGKVIVVAILSGCNWQEFKSEWKTPSGTEGCFQQILYLTWPATAIAFLLQSLREDEDN